MGQIVFCHLTKKYERLKKPQQFTTICDVSVHCNDQRNAEISGHIPVVTKIPTDAYSTPTMHN